MIRALSHPAPNGPSIGAEDNETGSMPNLVPLLALALLAAPPAAAADPRVLLDVNRLDAAGADCRVTLVERNGTAGDIASLKLDLVVFDKAGVVAKRVAVEAGPLKAGRSSVRNFDFKGVGCADIGRLLLNDVLACDIAGQPAAACTEALELTSRAGLPFER